MARRGATWWLAGTLLLGCANECQVHPWRSCACPNGGRGVQRCQGAESYGACVCAPDGGPRDGPGAIFVDVTSAPDATPPPPTDGGSDIGSPDDAVTLD